jgi:hypothetical protein
LTNKLDIFFSFLFDLWLMRSSLGAAASGARQRACGGPAALAIATVTATALAIAARYFCLRKAVDSTEGEGYDKNSFDKQARHNFFPFVMVI